MYGSEKNTIKSSEVVGVLRQDSLRSNFVFFVLLQVYRYLLFSLSLCLRLFFVQPKAFYRYRIQAKHNIESYIGWIGWVRTSAFCCCSFLHAEAPVISRTAKAVCCKLWNFCPRVTSKPSTCRPHGMLTFLYGKHGHCLTKSSPGTLKKLDIFIYFQFSSLILEFQKRTEIIFLAAASKVLQFPLGSCWSPPNWRNSWVWAMENRWEDFSRESDGAVRLVFQAAKKDDAFSCIFH